MRTVGAMILITPLLLGACSENEDKIVGHWNCKFTGDGGNGTAKIQYVKGGEFSGEMVANAQDSGVSVSFSAIAAGTWRIEDDTIYERITSFAITKLTIGGVPFPPDAVPADIKNTLLASSTTSTIITLDESNLVTRDPDGTATCRRR